MRLLLHTCCAPCSAAIIEWLLTNNIRPVLYYFNPNIYPPEEYVIRKSECLEHEPERGRRCLQCFRIRMLATARIAYERGFDHFATTLASSRWKSLEQIADAGHWAAAQFEGVEFLEKNWRKVGLSERRKILLAENGFYNQQYCGCEFSMRNTENRQPDKTESL